jgi:hypothetical protein
MLELARLETSVVLCTAAPEAIEPVCELGAAIRVAPDEVLLLRPPDALVALLGEAARRAEAVDEDAVVLDASDGWSVWALEGEGDALREAFSRLSELELRGAGTLQGTVADVPAKVLVGDAELRLLVPAMWDEHVRSRILENLVALGVTERHEPRAWNQLGLTQETGA